jgi:hypothetical protein
MSRCFAMLFRFMKRTALLGLILCIVTSCDLNDGCDTSRVSVVRGTNKNLAIEIVVVDCGATTVGSSQVHLTDSNMDGALSRVVLLVLDHEEEIEVKWTSPKSIEIGFSRCGVVTAYQKYGRIDITHCPPGALQKR